jgi:uncharacterized OB-fold protein
MATESIERFIDARAWRGNIPIENLYTVGIAGERFFREIKDNGRFLGTHCPTCDLTFVPPRIYCENCFAKLDEWVEIGTQGTVYTFTVLYEAPDGSRLEDPEIVALVELDGADGGIVHRLGEVAPEEVEIGLRVEAVFKPKSKREGSILDIEHFRPVKGA